MKCLEIIILVCTAGCVLGLDVYQDDIRFLKEELESLKSETSKFLILKCFFTFNYLHRNDLLALPENLSSPPVFGGARVARFLIFCVMFCMSLFVLVPLFFWPLFCLSFFDLWLLITFFLYKLSFVAFYNI